jgi:GT2 family glycosyltransferase/glycosyltransferase involved in cell wall biosynthesis
MHRSTDSADRETAKLIAAYFDRLFYLALYPDVAESGVDPLDHYAAVGAREGRSPNPFFHVAGYAYDNPDVVSYGGNPLLHYAVVGRLRGASPHPLFDADWYRTNYADVRASGADPYAHYLHEGRPKRRLPSAAVDDPTTANIEFSVSGVERVSVIVPTFGHFALTYRCLYAIAQRTSEPIEVIVVDDRPDAPLAPLLRGIRGIVLVTNEENVGFLRSCNAASQLAKGDYLVFLNNDTVVLSAWLESMIRLIESRPAVALVGSMLVKPEGVLEEAGGFMLRDGWGHPYGHGDLPSKPEYNYVRLVDCVRGASLLVRRSVFELVGGFDDRFAPAFFEEFDLAFSVRLAGYEVAYQPASCVLHYGGATYGRGLRGRTAAKNHATFEAKWSQDLLLQRESAADLFLARARPHRRGTIVVIDERVPEHDKSAGGLAVFQYLRLLARDDFKVVFIPHDGTPTEPYTSSLQQCGIEVLYGNIDTATWLSANGRFLDWVLCARPNVADAYIGLVRKLTRARLLYFTHDLHFLREQRRYDFDQRGAIRARAARLRSLETRIFKAVDCIMTASTHEAGIIKELAPEAQVEVIPLHFYEFGEEAVDSPTLESRRDIIFVGGYRHLPNVDAALFLIQQVMPHVWRVVEDAKVILVGSDPPPELTELSGPLVEVTGHVHDLEPYYRRSRMSVIPLRYGAGVKGKVLSSLAAGVPIVTTSVGNEGIDLSSGSEALIADDARGLAAHVISLFVDSGLLNELSRGGRSVIAGRYTEAVARAAMSKALGERGSRSSQ